MFSLQFLDEVNHEETKIMGLSSSEDRMIVAGVVLAWYQRVTDGQTESIMANTGTARQHSKLCWRAVKSKYILNIA